MSEVDTINKFLVGEHAGNIVFLRQIPMRLSHDDALNLAAWIVALADEAHEGDLTKFDVLLEAIENT